MSRCRFSPDGKLLAVAGRSGYVHLVDWSAGGAQVIGSVKGNATVKDMWWSRENEGELMTLGEDSQIYIWDVRARRCVKRLRDDGGYGALIMSGDPLGSYVAVGLVGLFLLQHLKLIVHFRSKSGIVNVYDSSALYSTSSVQPAHLKALKALGNLTTAVSSLTFNHDAQLMVMASSMKKDQLRLVHLPSCSVFQNWPTSGTPLGRVTAVGLSPNSGYLAVGNMRGRVLLYNIRHYSD
jgi:U3 small nucleolar RNA-associated protein 18